MNILLIATSFSPQNRIGAIRPTKIAKYLAKKGHIISVLTIVADQSESNDTTLNIEDTDGIDVFRIPYSNWFEHSVRLIRKRFLGDKRGSEYTYTASNKKFHGMLKSRIIGLLRIIYVFLEERSWAKQVELFTNRNLDVATYDAIISTSPKTSAHKVAMKLKHLTSKAIWIADFRDPMFYETNSFISKKTNKSKQNRIVHESSYTTVVSKGSIEKFLYKGVDKSKIVWISNGFDPDDHQLIIEKKTVAGSDDLDDTLILAYAGSLYGGKRDLSVIFKAIRSLMDKDKIKINNFRFFYAGSEGETVRNAADAYGLKAQVIDHGVIDRKEALSMMKSADSTIVCTHNSESDKGVIPGKIYESFMIGSPVIVIVNGCVPGSELGSMVTELHAGMVFEEANETEDYLKLESFLLEIYNEKKKTKNVKGRILKDKLQEFTYESIAGRFESLIMKGKSR